MAFILSIIPLSTEPERNIPIYILTNGVHTDIVVPKKNEIKDWSNDVPASNTQAKDSDADFIAFGWGDKGFYLNTPTWADLTFSTTFKAAFAIGGSVLHTTFYKKLKEDNNCRKILISKDQYRRLVNFIHNSFLIDHESNPIYITTDANYGVHDSFYEARGHYNLFYTCNTWANNALKASRQKSRLVDTIQIWYFSIIMNNDI